MSRNCPHVSPQIQHNALIVSSGQMRLILSSSHNGYGAQSGYQTSGGYDPTGAYAAPDAGYSAGGHHAGVVTPQRHSAAHGQYSAQQYSPQAGYGGQQSYGAQPSYPQQPSSYAQQPASAGYGVAAQYQGQPAAGCAGPADPGMGASKRDYGTYATQVRLTFVRSAGRILHSCLANCERHNCF